MPDTASNQLVVSVVDLDDACRVGGRFGPVCDVLVAESMCMLLAARRSAAVESATRNVVRFRSRNAWTRDLRDQLRRCLDRAAQRVYPPLDAVWYAHPDNLVFADADGSPTTSSPDAHDAFLALPLTMDLAEMTTFSVEGVCYGGDVVTRWKVPRVIREVAQAVGCEWLSMLPVAEGGNAWYDVMQHAMMKLCTRTPHVEPRGILVTGCIVAHTPYHALVAVPCGKMTTSGMVVIGRIPMPRYLAQQTKGQKRERDTQASSDMSVFGELAVVFAKTSGRKAPPIALEVSHWLKVDMIAFRAFASRSRGEGDAAAGTSSSMPRSVIELDDCYVLSQVDATTDVSTEALRSSVVHSYRDVCEMVQNSCRDALHLHNTVGAPLSTTGASVDALTVATVRVRSGMRETSKVQFGKDRKAFRDVQRSLADRHPLAPNGRCKAVPPALVAGTVIDAEETCLAEFKGRIADWVSDADTTAGNHSERQNASNRERLRHTICAMANTFGGYLVVGLGDDGRVVGIDAAAADIRISGFCPPMFNSAVVLNKHRVMESGGVGNSSAPSERRGLPEGWWKAAPASATPAVPPVTSGRGAVSSAPTPKVVSVVQVLRGTAPYYAPARYATPSMRGAASTVRMPVYICCMRLATHLPLKDEGDGLMQANHTSTLVAPTKPSSADAWSA